MNALATASLIFLVSMLSPYVILRLLATGVISLAIIGKQDSLLWSLIYNFVFSWVLCFVWMFVLGTNILPSEYSLASVLFFLACVSMPICPTVLVHMLNTSSNTL